jgi:hypothetical protein
MIYRNETLTDKSFDVDADEFYDCKLVRCTLRYNGGTINLHDTVTNECGWTIEGAARSTVDFLRYLNNTSGGRFVVDQIISEIRSPYSPSGPVN